METNHPRAHLQSGISLIESLITLTIVSVVLGTVAPSLGTTLEHHGHTALVGGVNHLLVTHGAAGLDDAGRTVIDHHIQTIAEREEGVARHHRTRQ